MNQNTLSASPQSHLDKFWAYVTVFGTLWGGIELTLGTFLHVLHVPKTGLIMVTLSVILLIAQRRLFPARGSTLCTGVVAACIKSLSPGGIIAGPIFGIMSEALIVELCLILSSQRMIFSLWAGMCAVAWSQVQSLFKMWIYYGQDFIIALSRVIEKFFRVEWSATLGWWLLATFFGIVATIGAVAGWIGARIGRSVQTEIDARLNAEGKCESITANPNPVPLRHTNAESEKNASKLATADDIAPTSTGDRRQIPVSDGDAHHPAVMHAARRRSKRPPVDNTQVLRHRRIVFPVAVITLIAQFSGQLIASSIALAVWLLTLTLFSRAILRAIWWPKFWALTTIISVAGGILIAWKLDGAWQYQLGIQATIRMMVRGIYVFSLISWMTRALRPKECLSIWTRLKLPKLGLAITRAYALLPMWNDKLHQIVQNRPEKRRHMWAYARQNIIACLVEASIQTELIRLDDENGQNAQ